MKRVSILTLIAASIIIGTATPVFALNGLPDFTGLVDEAGPAVVNIRVTQFGDRARPEESQRGDGSEQVPEFFRRFFEGPGGPRGGRPDRSGAGSGFIIEDDGYIVTNHHVVDGADEIIVRMADRREFKAELIGSDALSDVALLKVDAEDLPTLELGSSAELKRGEWVVAIGSPFNFDQSVTAGIVSAKGRSTNQQQYVPFIQTDVAINRGNSGGPLLNMDGEVVGINSWILSGGGGGYIGLSFSIPIETANRSITQLREHGKVSRGLLGVQVGAVTREMAEAFGLDRPQGALVDGVNPGSAAENAGVEPGDIILEFDGEIIEVSGDLPPIVGANPPGTEAEMVISRNGDRKTLTVVLDSLDSDEEGNLVASSSTDNDSTAIGLLVEDIRDDQRRALGDPEGGVVISRVEGDAAYRAGLRRGDVILMINSEVIESVDDFNEVVEDLEEGKAVALRVMREGVTRFIAFTPEAAE